MFRITSELDWPRDGEWDAFSLQDEVRDVRHVYVLHDQAIKSGLVGPETPAIDLHYWFLQLAERFLIQARLASDKAQSYRPFYVGSMLFVERDQGEIGIFYGFNVKPDPETPKVCSEKTAYQKAVELGFKRVIGVAVFGPTQEDHGSGLHHEVLHPCEACREMFSEGPLDHKDMLFTGANKEGLWEVTNLETILAYHSAQAEPLELAEQMVPPSHVALAAAIALGMGPDYFQT